MSAKDGFATAPPLIATRAELDRLLMQRAKPAAEMHLRPDGPEVPTLHARLNALRESRIADLRERLTRMRDGIERDHAFAQVQDRLGQAFERSRSMK